MRSRLDPPPEDLRILLDTAKKLRDSRGISYARGWLESGLDPMRFRVTDELDVVSVSASLASET